MYEWEKPVSANAVENRKHWLRGEVKRIANTTLRGEFKIKSDRQYWVDRLRKLNSELDVLEQM